MKLKITVHGVAYEVDVEVLDTDEGFPPMAAGPLPDPRAIARRGAAAPEAAAPAPAAPPAPRPAAAGGVVTSPIAGTVLEVRCQVGEAVGKDQILMVVEAMKMHTSIAAPTPGKVARVAVAVGDSVREGQPLIELE